MELKDFLVFEIEDLRKMVDFHRNLMRDTFHNFLICKMATNARVLTSPLVVGIQRTNFTK